MIITENYSKFILLVYPLKKYYLLILLCCHKNGCQKET